MTDITELAQRMKAAAEKATPGEWWADEVKNEGCYGSGDDCVEGFTSYAIYGSDGQTLFDSLNSDAACISEEYDGEGHVAWDETAQRNAEFIALANPANILALVEALEKAQQRIDELALAAMDSKPVAEVVSIYGDPEAFGEREIRPLVGIQQMPYGTKLYRHAQRPVVPNEITSASAPEVFEVAAEAERLGLRGTYASYAVGWNACRAAMLAAAQQEVQVVPKKIEQSRKRVNRCDVCTEGARGGCGTCIFNGNFE
ncbi:TPA: ead/Ea22-like family protein [Klebsiella pneumoniae]